MISVVNKKWGKKCKKISSSLSQLCENLVPYDGVHVTTISFKVMTVNVYLFKLLARDADVLLSW